jgi:hypothetical protein
MKRRTLQAWLCDQYQHADETQHTFDEVVGWFDAGHIDFVSSIPAADGTPITESSRLFEPQSCASKSIRVVV